MRCTPTVTERSQLQHLEWRLSARRLERRIDRRELLLAQRDLQRLPVGPNVLDAPRFRDRAYTGACEHPSKRDLNRRQLASTRNLIERRPLRQAHMIDWAVGHRRHLVRAHSRQQVELGSAPGDVVEDLIRRAREAPGSPERRHIVQVEVADAPMPNLALATQRLEAFHRLV